MFLAAATEAIHHKMTVYFLSLAVLLGGARLLGEIARRFGQPAVLGEMFAGILLGQTILGKFYPELFTWLFPASGPTYDSVNGFIVVGVTLLLLTAGLEVNLSTVLRQGRAAILVSLTGMLFPFIVGFGVAWGLGGTGLLGKGPNADMLPFALFVGVALSITALPVIARILIDLNMFKSDMGMMIVSAAIVNDLAGWIGFAMILALVGQQGDGNVGQTILYTLIFLVAMMTAGRWIFHRVLPHIQAHWSWPGGVIGFVLVVTLACAALTEWIGIHGIFGAFIAGVAIGDSPHLRERTRDTIHQFITYIFAPVFFASIGLRVNFVASFDIFTVAIVLVIAIFTKVIGCYYGARWAGMPKNQSMAVGFGMSARGAMEIILAQIALDTGLIDQTMFVAIVVMALTTSLMSGPIMQRLLRGKAQRKLRDLLTEKQFVLALKSHTVEGAIAELSERAAAVTDLSAGEISDAVWRREQIIHTGIGHGIAVPHARMEKLKKPLVILGRSFEGIDFDAPDGEPARVICMMLTPREDPDAQIEMLDLVARTFFNPETRAQTMEARSFTELLAAFSVASASEGHNGSAKTDKESPDTGSGNGA